MGMSAPFYDDFAEASALDDHTLAELARRMDAFEPGAEELRLSYPEVPTPLARPRTSALSRLFARRHSQRDFTGRSISRRRFSALLASARAWHGADHRSHAAAGARYAVELFAVCWEVDGLSGRVAYYDPVDHGVVTLTDPAPSWEGTYPALGLTVSGIPACLIVAVLFPDRVTAKYGELGGRFALLEAGAVMQSLSLATADQGLRGVLVGGLQERAWLRQLGLGRTGARVAFGYLVGR